MLLFSWRKILKAAKKRPKECLRIFRMLVTKRVPRNRWDPIYKYSKESYHGESFLYGEDELYKNSFKHSNSELCHYIALASLRSLGNFLATGDLTLDLIQAPVDPRDVFKDESLVYVDKYDKIHFVYEEIPKQ